MSGFDWGRGLEACPLRGLTDTPLQEIRRSTGLERSLKITWPLITHKHSRFGSHEVHTKILYRQSYLTSVTENNQNCLKSANLNYTALFDEIFS